MRAWLDICLMILPSVAASGPVFEVADMTLIPGSVGLVALMLAWPSSAVRTPVATA